MASCLPRFYEERSQFGSPSRRLSHGAKSVELGRDCSVCQRPVGVNKTLNNLKLCKDAVVGLMLAGAGKDSCEA